MPARQRTAAAGRAPTSMSAANRIGKTERDMVSPSVESYPVGGSITQVSASGPENSPAIGSRERRPVALVGSPHRPTSPRSVAGRRGGFDGNRQREEVHAELQGVHDG